MKYLTLIFLFTLNIHAQLNQTEHAVLEGITKLLGTPYYAVKKLTHLGTKSKYKKFFTETSEENLAWSNQSNQCKKICPRDYRILKPFALRESEDYFEYFDASTQQIISQTRSTEKLSENLKMAFNNETEEFKTIAPKTFGYCWGHSALQRRLQHLAIFKEHNEESKEELNKEGKLEYYKKRLQKIMRGKAQVIYGFNNLNELTADGDLIDLLKKMTVKEWKHRAVTTQGLGIYLKKKVLSKKKILKQLEIIEKKLATHQTPLLMFKHLTKVNYIHVVPVYKIIKDEEKIKICILDNHGEVSDSNSCGVALTINLNLHYMHFSPWDDRKNPEDDLHNISSFELVPEENFEEVNFVEELSLMCRELTQCQN